MRSRRPEAAFSEAQSCGSSSHSSQEGAADWFPLLSSFSSWSQNSRFLLTASRDWNAIIWDLSAEAAESPEGERRHTVRFDAPVTSAHLHPRNR